jgi:hypothetical protein
MLHYPYHPGYHCSRGKPHETIRSHNQYDAPILVGDANVVVAKLADYLKSVGY